jgi:hypothetical protein
MKAHDSRRRVLHFEAGGGLRTETWNNWLRLDLLPELQQRKNDAV